MPYVIGMVFHVAILLEDIAHVCHVQNEFILQCFDPKLRNVVRVSLNHVLQSGQLQVGMDQ